eukprot:gene9316-16447_t
MQLMELGHGEWVATPVIGEQPGSGPLVFRAVAEKYVADVMAHGFDYINPPKIYAAGQGGIYFSADLEDAIQFSTYRTNMQHMSMMQMHVQTASRRRIRLS